MASNDDIYTWLEQFGSKTINERIYHYLGSLGYTGSLSDRLSKHTYLTYKGYQALIEEFGGVATPSEQTISLLYGSSQLGTFYEMTPNNLYVDEAQTTHPANGDPVWWAMDRSGNNFHASAPSTATRPTYGTDGTHHWLYFNGAQRLSVPFAYLQGSPSITRFAAHRANSTADTGYVVGAGTGESTTILGGFRVSTDFQYRARRVSSDSQLQINIPNFLASNISTFQANYGTGQVFARNNGGQTSPQTLDSTGTLGAHSWSWIGALGDVGQFGYIGRVYSAIDVVDLVSANDILAVENYLDTLTPA